MISRTKHIESVDTPINPVYVGYWFGSVSVADAINGAFERIFDRALHMASRHGESTVILPSEWKDCSRNMSKFLCCKTKQLKMMALEAGLKYNCVIHVGKCHLTSRSVELRQCAFHTSPFDKNVGDIPTHWRDNEEDYTWAQVCENGEYYSTSSSERWPRPEYLYFARLEKASRKQRFDPLDGTTHRIKM